jgi:hypothetical protein
MIILITGTCHVTRAIAATVKALVEKYSDHDIITDDRPGVAALVAYYAARYTGYGVGRKAANGAGCYMRLMGTEAQRDNWLLARADMVVRVEDDGVYCLKLEGDTLKVMVSEVEI